jgi:hypothetical protein
MGRDPDHAAPGAQIGMTCKGSPELHPRNASEAEQQAVFRVLRLMGGIKRTVGFARVSDVPKL